MTDAGSPAAAAGDVAGSLSPREAVSLGTGVMIGAGIFALFMPISTVAGNLTLTEIIAAQDPARARAAEPVLGERRFTRPHTGSDSRMPM